MTADHEPTPLPHCSKPVAANPVGRWFSRFSCPHCDEKLQFSMFTNLLGAAGFITFFVAVNALLQGWSRDVLLLSGASWIFLIAASYGVRRVVKG